MGSRSLRYFRRVYLVFWLSFGALLALVFGWWSAFLWLFLMGSIGIIFWLEPSS